jgi:hypothetical protein
LLIVGRDDQAHVDGGVGVHSGWKFQLGIGFWVSEEFLGIGSAQIRLNIGSQTKKTVQLGRYYKKKKVDVRYLEQSSPLTSTSAHTTSPSVDTTIMAISPLYDKFALSHCSIVEKTSITAPALPYSNFFIYVSPYYPNCSINGNIENNVKMNEQ